MTTRAILKEFITRVLTEAAPLPALPGATGIQIGYINAHIPGDRRYGEKMIVTYDHDSSKVNVVVQETGAAGGMDTFNGATEATVTWSETCAADVQSILKTVKRGIIRNGSLIKAYGKPLKNFRWGARNDLIGLSANVVQKALDAVKGTSADSGLALNDELADKLEAFAEELNSNWTALTGLPEEAKEELDQKVEWPSSWPASIQKLIKTRKLKADKFFEAWYAVRGISY